MNFFSKYSLEARVFPSVLGLLPFYILQYYYLGDLFDFDFFKLEILSSISLSLVILYFFAEFPVRYIGKLYEDKIFKNKLNFPSVNFLMHSNKEYGVDFKKQIRKKIENDFSLILASEEEEIENEKEARLRIKDVVGLMISEVRDGHLLLRQNIAYGFVRNLWAVSIIGVMTSLLLVGFSFNNNNFIFYTGVVMIVLYAAYLLCGKKVIDYFSKNYARKLIEEYYKN